LQPDSGQIIKNGQDITYTHPSKRGMGIVFQNYALFENMTAFENIEYALKLNPKFKVRSKDIVNELLVQMNLTEHADKKPVNLSGGQQQRVAIARTLAINPDIILFDEPMSALDVETRLVLRKELKDLQHKYKNTMIYITHDQEEAFAMSDRILVMDTAVAVQIDTPENIIKHPANDYVKHFVIDNLKTKIDSLSKYINITNE
jgi:ABC-type Fe3+/spermidine/putrescine transport system ATPase subunit